MSADRSIEQIPFEPIFLIQVLCNCGCLQFVHLIQFVCGRRMMRFDEIDPTRVEGTEAAVNLETAGYEELGPFLRWVRRDQCVRIQINWDQEVCRHLVTLGVVSAPFPITVDHFGNRHGRFRAFNSLDQFRYQILTSELDLYFCWDNMCRTAATLLHHSQCFVVGVLCVNIEQSLARFPIHSARRRLWGSMLAVISTLVCRERRFRWGFETTSHYARIIRGLICAANDFALFHISIVIRNILRDQVVDRMTYCTVARRIQYEAYLGLIYV